jgi:apolipoprotein N-acyltransferase
MERLAGRIMLLGGAKRAILAFLAGALGALALPPFGFCAAMFVSFPLLVWLLDGISGNPDRNHSFGVRSAFVTGWLFGFGYFTAGLWWLGNALLFEAEEFAWALPLAVLGLPAVLAIFYGLATMLARLVWSDGMGRIAALAAGFGLAEWLRSFVATGFPWNAIGYAAMPMPLMMQSAAPLGLFGVSTLAVFVFAAPALLGTRKGLVPGLALAGLLFAAHLGYGAFTLREPLPLGANSVTVRLVQPVIDQAKKLENADRIDVFNQHLALSVQPWHPARRSRTDRLPETSIPFILTEHPDALSRVADMLKDGQVLVTGAVRAEEQGAGQAPRYYNSVYVIDDKGQILSASDKVHLTPFGEYVPYEEVLRRIGFDNLISLPGDFLSGLAAHASHPAVRDRSLSADLLRDHFSRRGGRPRRQGRRHRQPDERRVVRRDAGALSALSPGADTRRGSRFDACSERQQRHFGRCRSPRAYYFWGGAECQRSARCNLRYHCCLKLEQQ